MRQKLILPALLSMSAALTPFAVTAQTDITVQYVANPSFEADDTSTLGTKNESDGFRGWTVAAPKSWTVSGIANPTLLIDKDCYADNAFGQFATIPDGRYAFYMRVGWSSGQSQLSQTVTLPAGNYRLKADWRALYNGSATSSWSMNAAGASLAESFDKGGAGVMPATPWKTAVLDFTVAQQGAVTLSFDIDWVSGGSCIMFDNIRLYSTEGSEPVTPPTEADVPSPTEGVITAEFVGEAQMKADLMQMLADFALYMHNDFEECSAPNSKGEAAGCFRGENTMGNNEQGVRPNADLSMICAFLVKYGKDKVTLPAGVTWERLEQLAMRSLVYAYSTHKANKLMACKGNNYWGSTSASDHVWESSLWAMSVAYSAFFQWDKLTDAQRGYIKALLKAECNYELERSIPTGFAGDTKAEENGWEADVLAATLGLFPDDELAPRWFQRLREFAINSYSHISDADNHTVIDPEYDNTTVADLYKGKNLYDDYTLQNHNLFHTSYQNVVMQELGEAALALKLFQTGLHGTEKWKTNALMHNNRPVMEQVLNWLALADGELAMPNGNDWSLFLFDQITSYTTMACFLGDPDALMLENMAYKYIKARQKTTADGSWLLNADVGARRMGVQGHRVMMTWLMHHCLPTNTIAPTAWADFNSRHAEARLFTSQNIVRAATDHRFTCFSWSNGLKSYTGYFALNSPDNNKIIVPFRANNTGNLLGWYTVDGKKTDATPVVSGIYNLQGNAYTMNGELNTNGSTLNNRFAIYSTPGNALIYVDYVRGNSAGTITREQGGLLAISVDPFMKEKRTLYHGDGKYTGSDGKTFARFAGNYINIDNALGVVSVSDKEMGFGDRSLNNSINTAKLYTSYNDARRDFAAGDVVDRRNITYYSRVDAATTAALAAAVVPLTAAVPEGWNGVIAPDPDGTCYMLLANFASDTKCALNDITCAEGAPVFPVLTTVRGGKSSATFVAEQNNSIGCALGVFVGGADVDARLSADSHMEAYLTNPAASVVQADVTIVTPAGKVSGKADIAAGKTVRVSVADGKLKVEGAEMPADDEDSLTAGYTDVTARYLSNASFEEDVTYGTVGKSGSFESCYINEVAPADSKFPNVLPVKGWTPGNALEAGSNYCRMYSMPYSSTMYCVSEVGNYSAQCPPFLADDTRGERCLTVLNSWSPGTNTVSQTVTLPAGAYRLLANMRYECPNQESNDGLTIRAGNNVNTSLTGLSVADSKLYAYPAEAGRWTVMHWDFELDSPADVTFSAGYKSTANTGAANQSLLYIDNFRLLVKPGAGIGSVIAEAALVDVYTVDGRMVRRAVRRADATAGLAPGLYLVGTEKVIVR